MSDDLRGFPTLELGKISGLAPVQEGAPSKPKV